MTTDRDPILVAGGAADCLLLPAMANRHGLVAGATARARPVTLRLLAEAFPRAASRSFWPT